MEKERRESRIVPPEELYVHMIPLSELTDARAARAKKKAGSSYGVRKKPPGNSKPKTV